MELKERARAIVNSKVFNIILVFLWLLIWALAIYYPGAGLMALAVLVSYPIGVHSLPTIFSKLKC